MARSAAVECLLRQDRPLGIVLHGENQVRRDTPFNYVPMQMTQAITSGGVGYWSTKHSSLASRTSADGTGGGRLKSADGVRREKLVLVGSRDAAIVSWGPAGRKQVGGGQRIGDGSSFKSWRRQRGWMGRERGVAWAQCNRAACRSEVGRLRLLFSEPSG